MRTRPESCTTLTHPLSRTAPSKVFCNIVEGVGSSLLPNIYLDRLDRFVKDGLVPAHTRGSNAAQTLPGIAVPHDLLTPTSPLDAPVTPPVSDTTWDTALDQTRLAELLGQPSDGADSEAIVSGIAQLNRYLNRAWYRAGIPAQMHDDCSQMVYSTLLQNLGRPQFDSLVANIGHAGIRDVLSRETAEGPDFFRAVDTVKKRAQRERSFQPLDKINVVASPQEDETQLQRGAICEAIARSLNPREAALIHATMNGETPTDIASRWGVAPKTVSNEKTRVIQKLRTVLGTDVPD